MLNRSGLPENRLTANERYGSGPGEHLKRFRDERQAAGPAEHHLNQTAALPLTTRSWSSLLFIYLFFILQQRAGHGFRARKQKWIKACLSPRTALSGRSAAVWRMSAGPRWTRFGRLRTNPLRPCSVAPCARAAPHSRMDAELRSRCCCWRDGSCALPRRRGDEQHRGVNSVSDKRVNPWLINYWFYFSLLIYYYSNIFWLQIIIRVVRVVD